MSGMLRRLFCALLLLSPLSLSAQEPSATAPAAEQVTGEHSSAGPVDFITPHITDASYLELPYWKAPFHTFVQLPKWAPVHIGPLTIDFSPTKHVVMMLVAATLLCLVLIIAANSS